MPKKQRLAAATQPQPGFSPKPTRQTTFALTGAGSPSSPSPSPSPEPESPSPSPEPESPSPSPLRLPPTR